MWHFAPWVDIKTTWGAVSDFFLVGWEWLDKHETQFHVYLFSATTPRDHVPVAIEVEVQIQI